jgi:GNAT superfamily N-acetyltransferase
VIPPAAEERWTLRAAASRFVEVGRDEGPRTVWFKVLAELCYRRLGIHELRLGGPIPQLEARIPIAVAPLAEHDVDEYAALSPNSDPAQIGPRLAAGHACYVARGGSELVGSCWVARGTLWSDYLHTNIDLAGDEACTYETYTAPRARGRGIGAALRGEVARILGEAGDSRLLATVEPENAPAVRMVEKLGYRRIGTIGYFGVGSRRKHFCRMEAGESPPGARGRSSGA